MKATEVTWPSVRGRGVGVWVIEWCCPSVVVVVVVEEEEEIP